jgi:glycosyltransferase involved in cell wall biosynthesis
MVARTPVIGSDSGEIPNVIGGGPGRPEHAQALAAARLGSDPALRADLARRGRQRVLGHFPKSRSRAGLWRSIRKF